MDISGRQVVFLCKGRKKSKRMSGQPRPYLNCMVAGNIASGKSTVVKSLTSQPGYVGIFEPLDQWKESGFINAFYGNMDKYGFPFQMYAFITRLKRFKKANLSGAVCVVADAHIYTDKNVFAKGLLSKQEMGWYNETYDGWEELFPEAVPDVVFYLKASPEQCLNRIKERMKKENRHEESTISLEYLSMLNENFDRVLNPESSECRMKNVIVVDADKPEGEVLSILQNHIDKYLKPTVC